MRTFLCKMLRNVMNHFERKHYLRLRKSRLNDTQKLFLHLEFKTFIAFNVSTQKFLSLFSFVPLNIFVF